MNTMTADEITETADLIRIETRSQNLRRAALESELAEATTADDARRTRKELARVDAALMQLQAGRLPAR